ncbi:hypothetical protein ACM0AX_10835 [Mycobacteroides abscessus subsp. abscessus]|uniref:hypothetical protein n=1 Tax=Mycobacteroides abscessus TaxID=36809 RepID=UPI0039EE6FAC
MSEEEMEYQFQTRQAASDFLKILQGEPIESPEIRILVMTSISEADVEAGVGLRNEILSGTDYRVFHISQSVGGSILFAGVGVIGLFIVTSATKKIVDLAAEDLYKAIKSYLSKRIVRGLEKPRREIVITINGPDGKALKQIRVKDGVVIEDGL